MDEALKAFERTALTATKVMDEFFAYQGDNKKYFNRARMAAVAMGAYSRVRATRANEAGLKHKGVSID